MCGDNGSYAELKTHEEYMRLALDEAQKAAAGGDVPIGCVIVYRGSIRRHKENRRQAEDVAIAKHREVLSPGQVIARGHNRRNFSQSALAHAEIGAIAKACAVIGDWRLENCLLYVTLEPCQMCAGAIIQARIPMVIIGAPNPKAGCAGSILNLFEVERFNHRVDVITGVMQEECAERLQVFFAELRNNDGEK